MVLANPRVCSLLCFRYTVSLFCFIISRFHAETSENSLKFVSRFFCLLPCDDIASLFVLIFLFIIIISYTFNIFPFALFVNILAFLKHGMLQIFLFFFHVILRSRYTTQRYLFSLVHRRSIRFNRVPRSRRTFDI